MLGFCASWIMSCASARLIDKSMCSWFASRILSVLVEHDSIKSVKKGLAASSSPLTYFFK